jgi:hypothetical protein
MKVIFALKISRRNATNSKPFQEHSEEDTPGYKVNGLYFSHLGAYRASYEVIILSRLH